MDTCRMEELAHSFGRIVFWREGVFDAISRLLLHQARAEWSIHTVWFIRDTVKFPVWLSLGKF